LELRPIYLTGKEAALLRDIVDAWKQGLPEAKEKTITDDTPESVEQLLVATGGLDEMDELCRSILNKLAWSDRG
jgi:hypothetical protein